MKTIHVTSISLVASIIGSALSFGCAGEAGVDGGFTDEEFLAAEEQAASGNPGLNRYDGPELVTDVDPTGPDGEVTLPDAEGNLRTWQYEVINGMAVAQGDIVLGSLEDVLDPSKGLILTGKLWPKRTMVYKLNAALSATQKTNIATAMTNWTNATGAQFKLRSNEADYVEFQTVAGVCQSAVGRKTGKQTIDIDSTGCGVAAITHEIGHAWGLEHEATRSDRATKIDYHSDRVLTTKAYNFTINDTAAHKNVGDIDFSSIMMYDSYAFSATDSGTKSCKKTDAGCKPTLTLAGTETTWNAPTVLSAGDIKAFRTLYSFFDAPRVKVNQATMQIRWFSASNTNKNQFCILNGYTKATNADTNSSRAAGTSVASWNSAEKAFNSSVVNVQYGAYDSITCGF